MHKAQNIMGDAGYVRGAVSKANKGDKNYASFKYEKWDSNDPIGSCDRWIAELEKGKSIAKESLSKTRNHDDQLQLVKDMKELFIMDKEVRKYLDAVEKAANKARVPIPKNMMSYNFNK